MTLLAVPNLSEGRDAATVGRFVASVEAEGAAVLDVHSDPDHNRSVLTLSGPPERLVRACTALARAASTIDVQIHQGAHPRLGGLDVCPFVPHNSGMEEAIAAARSTAEELGLRLGLPVYLYGHAATRASTRELPDLRRGGLAALARRASRELPPDTGPKEIDLRRGVVCVGARGPLIAFNVWLKTDLRTARAIATEVRSASVRALGLALRTGTTQVSMNLIDPPAVGIEEAFEAVRLQSDRRGAEILATEIVGLVERRYLPAPDATATRLLLEPDRCLEERLLERC